MHRKYISGLLYWQFSLKESIAHVKAVTWIRKHTATEPKATCGRWYVFCIYSDRKTCVLKDDEIISIHNIHVPWVAGEHWGTQKWGALFRYGEKKMYRSNLNKPNNKNMVSHVVFSMHVRESVKWKLIHWSLIQSDQLYRGKSCEHSHSDSYLSKCVQCENHINNKGKKYLP